jgi:hypothetical protein
VFIYPLLIEISKDPEKCQQFEVLVSSCEQENQQSLQTPTVIDLPDIYYVIFAGQVPVDAKE